MLRRRFCKSLHKKQSQGTPQFVKVFSTKAASLIYRAHGSVTGDVDRSETAPPNVRYDYHLILLEALVEASLERLNITEVRYVSYGLVLDEKFPKDRAECSDVSDSWSIVK